MSKILMGALLLSLALPAQANRIQELAEQAGTLAQNGYTSSAIEVYQRAITLDSQQPLSRQNASLSFNVALLLIDSQKLDLAVTALEKTILIDPQHLKGHFNLGLLYSDLGKPEQAQKELSTALALSSSNPTLAAQILDIIDKRHLVATESAPTPKPN